MKPGGLTFNHVLLTMIAYWFSYCSNGGFQCVCWKLKVELPKLRRGWLSNGRFWPGDSAGLYAPTQRDAHAVFPIICIFMPSRVVLAQLEVPVREWWP